jgi:ribosomal protein S18 acetylase RimI-like enzyme
MSKIDVRAGDAPDIDAFLAKRIYEYNARATGYDDGESYSAVCRGASDAIVAGVCGFTWGGLCYVSYLWVSEALRGRGMGTELMRAVEDHARAKRCRLVLLSTHDFQAPGFYARLGYEPVAQIEDYPVDHMDFFLAKRLDG